MKTATEKRHVNVYSVGLVCCSACAPLDMSRDEVEATVNAQHPTGISSQWHISTDETFKSGEPNPFVPDGDCGRHWLLNC